MKQEPDFERDPIVDILYTAYINLVKILYTTSFSEDQTDEIITGSIKNGCPLNIRTNEYDHRVRSSIKSDTIVLDTINKILTLMYTTNQYLVPTPAHNVYVKY